MDGNAREARASIKHVEVVAIRVFYFLAMTAVVLLYPLTKFHIQTLAFTFIFVITGVMLFFTIVKLEVAGVSQSSLARHRDRIFFIGVVHWMIYGTLYYLTDMNIDLGWVAFLLQFVSSALYVIGIASKSAVNRFMEERKNSAWTMRCAIVTLYAYNVVIMLPIRDNNLFMAPIYTNLPRYGISLISYILYVANYQPYVCPTPGVLLVAYIINTCMLYMNSYILAVVGTVSIVYHAVLLVYKHHDSIMNVLHQEFRVLVELDGENVGEQDDSEDGRKDDVREALSHVFRDGAVGGAHAEDLFPPTEEEEEGVL